MACLQKVPRKRLGDPARTDHSNFHRFVFVSVLTVQEDGAGFAGTFDVRQRPAGQARQGQDLAGFPVAIVLDRRETIVIRMAVHRTEVRSVTLQGTR